MRLRRCEGEGGGEVRKVGGKRGGEGRYVGCELTEVGRGWRSEMVVSEIVRG